MNYKQPGLNTSMHARFEAILQAAGGPLSLKAIVEEIVKSESRPINCSAIQELLSACPYVAEVEKDLWLTASCVIDGRLFFAIPEHSDIEIGQVCFVGGDLFLLMRLAVVQGQAEFVAENGTVIPVKIGFEDTGYFYARGLENWYKQTKFVPERDSILLTAIDYRACRYAIRRLPESALDEYVSRNTRMRICNWLLTFLTRKPERFPGSLITGFSTSGALCYLLYNKSTLFNSFPCNLSFYMSLDERFFVTGKQFFLRDEDVETDFSEHYIGRDNGMLLEPQDVGKFNRALEALFGIGDAKQAKELFSQLQRDYPQERLLHKYIYQAAWQLEDYELVRRHATIYRRTYARDPDALCTLAEVAIMDGDFDKAKQYLSMAEERVHQDDKRTKADISAARMRIYWECGEDVLAVFEAKRLLALEPGNDEALMLLEEHPQMALPLRESKGVRAHIIRADFANRKVETGENDDS
jgi:tetratricopeptide (TPR) repeat protein